VSWFSQGKCHWLEMRAVAAGSAGRSESSAGVPTQRRVKLDSIRDPVFVRLAISNAPMCYRVHRSVHCSCVFELNCGS